MNRVTEMAKNTYVKSINEVNEAKCSRASETSDNFDIALEQLVVTIQNMLPTYPSTN